VSSYTDHLTFAERWRRMVKQAISPQALEYITRQAYRKEALTPELADLIAQREKEIEEEAHGLFV
jgi:hypothetical protein